MVTHLGDGNMELYIYILLMSLRCIETKAINSECGAPIALKGMAAFVTCRFDTDISKLRQDFQVRRVPVNVSVMNAEVVISCNWDQAKISCRRHPDYQLDSPVTRQFTVKITEVGNQHAGKFMCTLVSHNPGTYDYCELVVTESQTSTFPALPTKKLKGFKEGNEIDQHNKMTSHYKLTAAHSECEAPAAQKGSVAFVTCRFDSDISKLRQDFEVRHVPVNVSVMNAEVVISCYWNQEKSFCRSRPDYQLDSQITNQFTVKITEVENQHAGKFICMLVSHNPGTYGYCELVVTESRSSTFPTLLTTKPSSFKEVSTRSVIYNVATSGFSILNGNGSDQHKEMTSPLTTDVRGNSLVIALSITAVLMILAMCAIFVILRKYKRECCKRPFFSPLLRIEPDVTKLKSAL